MARRGKFFGRISDMGIFELIVQLRRGAAGAPVGHRRLHRGAPDQAAWQELRSIVEGDVEAVCRGSDTRWLVSICDTYADFGDPVERAGAMLVVLLANWEKCAWTLRNLTGAGTPRMPEAEDRNAPLWDGVASIDLLNRTYDMPRNLFGRLRRALSPAPHLQRIFQEVAWRMADADGSTPALLNRASVHRDLCSDICSSVGGTKGDAS